MKHVDTKPQDPPTPKVVCFRMVQKFRRSEETSEEKKKTTTFTMFHQAPLDKISLTFFVGPLPSPLQKVVDLKSMLNRFEQISTLEAKPLAIAAKKTRC